MDKSALISTPQTGHVSPRKMLYMGKNDRMGGSVPTWEAPVQTSQNQIEQNLSRAQYAQPHQEPRIALAYNGEHAGNAQNQTTNTPQEFTFGDMVDMINPLHHIPLVGHAYRSLSGDEIKPIGRIMGGTIFGGPIGAASGLLNVIIQEETGKDLAGNALSIAHGERQYSNETKEQRPEARLNNAVKIAKEYDDLSNALLAFSAFEQAEQNHAVPKEKSTHLNRRYND